MAKAPTGNGLMDALDLIFPTEARSRTGARLVAGRQPEAQPTTGNYVPILVLMAATGILLWAAVRRPVAVGSFQGDYQNQQDGNYAEAYGGNW